MFFMELLLSGTVVPPVAVFGGGPVRLTRHHVGLRPEYLPGVLGHELDDPDLLLGVHHAGEGGRALAGAQQRWPEY